MKVYLFKPQFARLVEAGTKRTTIRPKRKHPAKVGDELSLREWTGKPYRSKQRILREGERCKAVYRVKLTTYRGDNCVIPQAFINGVEQIAIQFESLARDDGFTRTEEGTAREQMIQWFRDTHGLPFEGEMISW